MSVHVPESGNQEFPLRIDYLGIGWNARPSIGGDSCDAIACDYNRHVPPGSAFFYVNDCYAPEDDRPSARRLHSYKRQAQDE
jgi:hypothetical protein